MASALQVKVKGTFYPIEQLIDKTIYAGNQIAKLYPGPGGKALFQVQPGGVIGKMYSWNTASDGTVYLTFYTSGGAINEKYANGYYVVKLSDINGDDLKKQGAKTTDELIKEEEEKNATFGDKALKTITNIALGIAVIYFVAQLAKGSLSNGR